MTQGIKSKKVRAIATAAIRAKCDPGAVTPRGDNFKEPLQSWEKRAVELAIAPFIQAKQNL